ncbi:RNA 2',3'-cyclic phosphodiesterase [Chloroflexota bacterium]
MEQVRSFIATELPDELRQELGELEARLKSAEPAGIKWVDPYGIHLTLKFLGNIAVDRIEEITGAIAQAAEGITPFHLAVKDLGIFPNLRRPQVVWVGMSGEIDKLCQLQKQIESHLARLGFAAESRSFTPHLTLARLRNQVSPQERQKFGHLIAGTSFEAANAVEVDTICLMRSQLTRAGSIYSSIGTIGLKKL